MGESSIIIHFLCPSSLALTSTGREGLWFCGYYVQEHPKAQPAVTFLNPELKN